MGHISSSYSDTLTIISNSCRYVNSQINTSQGKPLFANGYLTLEDNTLMQWCVDNDFCREVAKAVRFDDPDIKWQTAPWPKAEYILSEKDKSAMRFKELT